MLSILVSWIFCGFIFFTFGKLLVNLFHSTFLKSNYGIGDIFFIGISVVGTILAIISIWFPVNTITAWILFFLALIYTVYLGKQKKGFYILDILKIIKSIPLTAKVLIILIGLVIISFNILPPLIFDTRLYYLQSIMWNEAYPVIPGLGNIHGRLGFNSNVLLLNSAFSIKDIFSMRIFGILGISFFVFLSWIIVKIFNTQSFRRKLILVTFSFIFFYSYAYFITSPATDPLPNIFISYILLRMILDKNALKESPLLFIVLPVYAITLKLSVIVICIIPLLLIVYFIRNNQYKKFITLVGLSLLIVVPWIIRNIIITGYIIYPYPSLDLFDFDWKIPEQLAGIEKTWVSAWAKVPGLSPQDFENMPLWEWGSIWLLNNIKWHKFQLLIYIIAAISPLFIWWKFKKSKEDIFRNILPWIIGFCGFIFWFLMAPDPRFGLGFILIAGLSPFMINERIWKPGGFIQKIPAIFYFIGIIYIASFSFDEVKKNKGDKTYLSFLYTPQSIDFLKEASNKEFISHRVGEINVYQPSGGDQCFDYCIPCTPYFNKDLEMRGNCIEDGFRIKK